MNVTEKNKILEEIASNNYLPSLSPLTIQLIDLAADENSSILDLTRIIEQDPGLTTRLLKLVNSAFYAHREPISSISYAVMMAGFKKIRMMALNISLRDTFPLGKVKGMDFDFFWKTSLYRATLAQGLAKGSYLSKRLDPEEAFTAGLILELGLLLLFHICPDELKETFPGGDVPLEQVIRWEEAHLGLTHRELGRLTLQHWHFPEPIVEAQNIFGPEALKSSVSDLCRLMEIARICTQLFLGPEEDFALLKEIAGLLNMDLDHLSEILTEVFFKVEEMAREMRLQISSDKDLLEVMGKANRALIRINGSLEDNLVKILNKRSQEDDQERSCGPDREGEEDQNSLAEAMEAVAHEIRNPLMAIGGFAQRLLKKGEDQVNVSQYAELIARESLRLEGVLKDLMTYSTPYQPAFSSQDVVLLLEKIITDLQAAFISSRITLKKSFEVKNLFIAMDREALQRSLHQLLEIVAGLSEKGERTVGLSLDILPSISKVRIGFKFPGEPLPEEIKEVLHGRDFSSRAFGQNIPLSLCRKIIESHRGCLESGWEKGENRIWVLLPLPTQTFRI